MRCASEGPRWRVDCTVPSYRSDGRGHRTRL